MATTLFRVDWSDDIEALEFEKVSGHFATDIKGRRRALRSTYEHDNLYHSQQEAFDVWRSRLNLQIEGSIKRIKGLREALAAFESKYPELMSSATEDRE